MSTTRELIEQIYDNSLGSTLQQHIQAAEGLVGGLKLALSKDSEGVLFHNTTTIQTVETWLAAHFASIEEPREVSGSASGGSESFESVPLLNYLGGTRYGQQAMALDFSGILNKYNDNLIKGRAKRSKVTLTSLGWTENA